MTKSIISRKVNQILLLIFVGFLWFILSCNYEPLTPPELPTWYQTINLPLADASFFLSELQDTSNNIYGDSLSDSLFFKFSGALDTTTLTEDIFLVPAVGKIEIRQDFSEISEVDISLDETISNTVYLSDIIPISFPLDYPFTIETIPHTKLLEEEHSYQVFDKNNIPFFKRVDYITIESGSFTTRIENMLYVSLDSVLIRMSNIDGEIIAESFYDHIPHGQIRENTEDLSGEKLRDSIKVFLTATIDDTNNVEIPANTDPYLTISIGIKVEEVESVTGIPEPIQTDANQSIPPSNNTIIRAVIGQTTTDPPDTNLINLDVENTLPLDFRMNIKFLNFYSSEGMLEIDTDVDSNSTVSESIRLDGDTLRNLDAISIVDSILVTTEVELLPNTDDTLTTIPFDIGEGEVYVSVEVTCIKLKEIVGFFNESFSIPSMTISNIPTGFSDVNFGEVILNLHFFNEIQAQTDLLLNLQGFREDVEPVLIEVDESINKATESQPIAESGFGIDIATIFNMVPDSILISGEAAIPANDTSRLQVGKSFWGIYDIVVPFKIKIEGMTFIPVKSSEMAPMDQETRKRIRDGLVEASIIADVVNDFPISGSVQILFSNYDYFPLDSAQVDVDSGYQWIDDSLFAETDTGMVYIDIDTLISVTLPLPEELHEDGSVKIPGKLYQVSTIDSLKLEAIMSDETHFIRPRIHFNETDGFVSVKYNDCVQILCMISFIMDTGGLINPEEESEQDTISAENLGKPIVHKEKFYGFPRNKESVDCENLFHKKVSLSSLRSEKSQ